MEELGLKLSIYQIKMRNKKLFDEKHQQALKAKNKNKFSKGAKIKRPEENEELRLEDLRQLQKAKDKNMPHGPTAPEDDWAEYSEEEGSDGGSDCENELMSAQLEADDLAHDLLSIDNMTI